MKQFVFAVLIVTCLVASVAEAQLKAVLLDEDDLRERYSPRWAVSTGNVVVTIRGCGFRTYSEVQCYWDSRWTSHGAVIQDDNTITCETPAIPDIELKSLPQWTRLDLVFDGDRESLTLEVGPFRFGPAVKTPFLTPDSGNVGSASFQIIGEGFSEFSSVEVRLDNVTSGASISSDTAIAVSAGAGEYNQDAMVQIWFGRDDGVKYNYYLHVPKTFHRGPRVVSINPTCTTLYGGTSFQITLDRADPFVSSLGGVPFVRFEGQGNGIDGEGAFIAGTLSGSTITVTAPTLRDNQQTINDNGDRIDPSSAAGYDATLTVFFDSRVLAPFGVRAVYPVQTRWTEAGEKVPTLHYGPQVFTVTPTIGHLGGGDTITIEGCGFSNYTKNTEGQNIVGAPNSNSLCTAESITVVSNTRITCTTVAGDNDDCLSAQPATLNFDPAGATVNDADLSTSNQFRYGPFLTDSGGTTFTNRLNVDVSTARVDEDGMLGANSVTEQFSGQFLRYRADSTTWSEVTFTLTNNPASPGSCSVPTDTSMSCGPLPTGDFDEDYPMNIRFVAPSGSVNTPCTYVTDVIHYGPRCNVISPTFGPIAGGNNIQVTGVGFSQYPTFTVRLSEDPGFHDTQVSSSGDTSFSFATPTMSNEEDRPGSIVSFRDFGSTGTITLRFAGDGSKTISCPSYRFGPITTAITPRKGPMGPHPYAKTGMNSGPNARAPETPVTITGAGFLNDGFFESQAASKAMVAFGNILGHDTAINSATSLSTKTIWGGTSTKIEHVYTIFDTCNTTWTDVWYHWGPRFDPDTPLTRTWGFLPDGSTEFSILGEGFLENGWTESEVRVLVDGKPAECGSGNGLAPTTDTAINCRAPVNDFGTEALVSVQFGDFYDSGYNGNVENWEYCIDVPETIHYTPRILSISPSVSGMSGGQPIQVTGEGFEGWTNALCFFGQFTDSSPVAGPLATNSFMCNTPVDRGEFGKQVSFLVQFNASNPSMDFTNGTWQVVGPDFTWGPVCTGVTAVGLPLNQNTGGNIAGLAFVDPRWDNITVSMTVQGTTFDVTQGDGTTFSANQIPFQFQNQDFNCGAQVTAHQINFWHNAQNGANFDDNNAQPLWRITNCPISVRFGPAWTLNDRICATQGYSVGWTNDTLTLSGVDLNEQKFDGALTRVRFGSTRANPTSVGANQIQVTVPSTSQSSPFGSSPIDLKIDYYLTGTSINSPTCTVDAGQFRFGPVITSVTPSYGYLNGDTDITLHGCGFQNQHYTGRGCAITDNNRRQDSIADTNTAVVCPGFAVQGNPGKTTKVNGFWQVDSDFNGGTPSVNASVLSLGPNPNWIWSPIVGDTPETVRWVKIRGSTFSINGCGFSDPEFDDPYCVLNGPRGTIRLDGQVFSDTRIDCEYDADQLYHHRCGDVETVLLNWNVSQSIQAYTYTPAGANNGQVKYGPPPATAVSVSSDGDGNVNDGFRGPFDAETTTSITISGSFDEWSSNNQGNNMYRCIFGDRILNKTGPVGSGQVVCSLPDHDIGYFTLRGQIGVILDPHDDALTTLEHSWRWVPFITHFSRDFGQIWGYDTITVHGGGYSNYDTAVCYFGNNEAVQGDITDEWTVTCSTPRRQEAQSGPQPVRIEFCHELQTNTDCNCTYLDGTVDQATSPVSFTYEGVNSITLLDVPESSNGLRSGPTYGNTRIQVSGFGFSRYSLKCLFGGVEVDPTAASGNSTGGSDTTVICTAPAVDSPQVVDFGIRGTQRGDVNVGGFGGVTWWQGAYEYNTPQLTSISPNELSVDEAAGTTITATGRYFNGGSAWKCRFRHPSTDDAYETDATQSETNKFQISCPVHDNVTVVGDWLVSIGFGSNPSASDYTTDDVFLSLTQTPDLVSVSPTRGSEFGGLMVTITGNNFNGAQDGKWLVRFGTHDATITGAIYAPASAGPTPPPVAPVAPPTGNGTAPTPAGNNTNTTTPPAAPTAPTAPTAPVASNSTNSTRTFRPYHTSIIARGQNDRLIVRTPDINVESDTNFEISVSLDGGATWSSDTITFEVKNGGAPRTPTGGEAPPDVGEICDEPGVDAAASLVASMAMLVLAAAVALLL